MRAILPGRPQSKRQALCTAQWDGLRLVAYISGNTAIILDGPRTILQTLLIDNSKQLTSISIEETSGRVAVGDENRVQVYNAVGRDEGDLRWSHAHEIVLGPSAVASCLSWGSEQELLIGGTALWLYYLPTWNAYKLIWHKDVANPVVTADMSNDSALIASFSQHDRIVKIWRRLSYEVDSTRFDVSYLPHPGAVTNIHWRKPWHAEQSLDNLLYTICSDNQVRLWTYSDSHSLSVMQLIATIDMNASIQPRRLSTSSVSRKRYVFILDSRDFSQATEKALQRSRAKAVDHALEHLVEVANRSPEICVVFDGLGHMSAWGLENAGCKSKKPTILFNVALVDDVRMQLTFSHQSQADYIQFCSFAGGSEADTLSLLVQSYTGQIDWYESPIAEFFDTSSRQQRLQLVSSWSGHDLSIDHIARANDVDEILSWTDEGQAILWIQTTNGALRRKFQTMLPQGLLAAIILDGAGHIISLHPDRLALWDISREGRPPLCAASLQNKSPRKLVRLLPDTSQQTQVLAFVVEFESSGFELWHVKLSQKSNGVAQANGNAQALTKALSIHTRAGLSSTRSTPIDVTEKGDYTWAQRSLLLVDDDGSIQIYRDRQNLQPVQNNPITLLQTGIWKPLLVRAAACGMLAITDKDGKTLSIWNLKQASYEWHHRFDGPDHIQKMAWTSTKTGHLLLFVSFSFHAIIIGQVRYANRGKTPCWTMLQDISLRRFTTNFIGDVSWLPSTDLAIGAGNQIFVLESNITRLEPSAGSVTDKQRQSQKASEYIDVMNSTLPIFHPTFLHSLVVQGLLDEVTQILLSLYEKLKYFADGDNLDSFLDREPTAVLISEAPAGNGHVEKSTTEAPVSGIAEILRNNIVNSNIWQIKEDVRVELSDFVLAFVEVEKHRKSLDMDGLRYLFALYSTPREEQLSWKFFVFASRSVSQEALLDIIYKFHGNKVSWATARRTGLFVWLEDRAALQTQFENVARAEYNKHEDRNPVDCSLHYLALNKKSVLQGLWRMTVGVKEKENTIKLLANNFDEPRWKSTALKNAYALLSKRRFEYSAAFFLLGSSLKDAVNICVNQLDDIQLAIAICRIWEKDSAQAHEVLQSLLQDTIMHRTADDDQGRWMAVLAHSMLGNFDRAIQAMIRPLHNIAETKQDAARLDRPLRSMSYRANDPHLAIVYVQLRALLEKQGKWTTDVLDHFEERAFVIHASAWLTRAGLDLIGLHLVANWKFINLQVSTPTPSAFTPGSNDVPRAEKQDAVITLATRGRPTSKKPAPTQFVEPSVDSLLDSFGF